MTKIYVIQQYQPYAGYDGEPIAVFDTLEQARKQAELLNKKYADNVNLSDDYFTFRVADENRWDDDHHAYTIKALELNKEIPFLED